MLLLESLLRTDPQTEPMSSLFDVPWDRIDSTSILMERAVRLELESIRSQTLSLALLETLLRSLPPPEFIESSLEDGPDEERAPSDPPLGLVWAQTACFLRVLPLPRRMSAARARLP